MPRLIIALIRHGEYSQRANTPSALQPYPLNEKGQQQAREAAKEAAAFAKQQGWVVCSKIDSSTLLRAWQTAEAYRVAFQENTDQVLDVACYDGLCERSVGSAANLNLNEISAIIQADPRFITLPAKWKSDSHFCLPLVGAESLMAAGARVAKHIRDSVNDLDGGEQSQLKIFVGHGAAFRHAAHLLGVLDFEQIAELSMFHATPVYLELINGRYQHVGGEWKLRDKKDSALD